MPQPARRLASTGSRLLATQLSATWCSSRRLPTADVAALLAERGALAPGVPLLKRMAARAGQTVCRIGERILVDGQALATTRDADRLGRPLPRWSGCLRLDPGFVFLLNRDAPDSLDGRYFGPTPAGAVQGRAIPLWTSMERRS